MLCTNPKKVACYWKMCTNLETVGHGTKKKKNVAMVVALQLWFSLLSLLQTDLLEKRTVSVSYRV